MYNEIYLILYKKTKKLRTIMFSPYETPADNMKKAKLKENKN